MLVVAAAPNGRPASLAAHVELEGRLALAAAELLPLLAAEQRIGLAAALGSPLLVFAALQLVGIVAAPAAEIQGSWKTPALEDH